MTNEHDETAHDDAALKKNAHAIHPKKEGGGAWKWLAGAAAAALLVGGGYLVWKNNPAPTQQAALSDNYDVSSSASAPADAQNPVAETASAPSETATVAPHRAASNAPAEEVVGIVPVSATTGDSDDIVVQGARRLSESYPYRALERGQEGEAQVSCTVGESGAMRCVKVSESPLHAGFGAAAVHVAQMYRHADLRADGTPAAGTPVNVRVLFRVGEDGRTF